MKVTFAVCADRAVGFGAAFVGLVLLYATARHLAPIGTFESMRAPGADAPAVVARVTSRPTTAPVVSSTATARAVATAHVHIATIVRRPAPRAAERAVSLGRERAPVRHPGVGTRAGSVARSVARPARVAVRPASPVASAVAAVHLQRAEPRRGVREPSRVASARVASSENRPSAAGPRSRVASKPRPRTRPTASAAFRIPARFDVRPALVTVSDASVATLPADDALPTMVARQRRR